MANITAAHANILTDTSDGDLSAAETVPSDVRVFSTPELLKGILSQLSVLDLVIATGVNKTFRNAIKACPRLQRQLFIIPMNNKTEYWKLTKREIAHTSDHVDDSESDDDELDTQRRLLDMFRALMDGAVYAAPSSFLVSVPSDTDDRVLSRRTLQVVSLCPLLSRPLQTPHLFEILGKSISFKVKFDARANIATEPWSHMFLSNPPSRKVKYELAWESHVYDTWDAEFTVRGTFHCEEGITLANLKNHALRRRGDVVVCNGIEGLRYQQSTNPQVSVGVLIGDTTLHEQITAFQNECSECVIQMIAEKSSIEIVSKVAPTEEDYEQLSTLGRVKTSVSR
jgi:hypothetical protein